MSDANVLIIEDDRELANLYGTIAGLAGLTTEQVHDGQEALDRLRCHPVPRIIILDMHLPRVSGQEIFEAIQAMQLGSRVIISTADVQLAESFYDRAHSILVKPISVEQMIDTLREFAS